MGQPRLIELECGADLQLRIFMWLIWLTAGISTAIHFDRMGPVLLTVCFILLAFSWPLMALKKLPTGKLRLHANGSARTNSQQGTWTANTWRTHRYTVINVILENSKKRVWISARMNAPDDYRRLGVWCRFSPIPEAHNQSVTSADGHC